VSLKEVNEVSAPQAQVLLGARQFFERRGAPLPYDAEVQYLQSSGTQFIDTGVKLRTTDVIEARVYINSANTGGWYGMMGAYDGTRYLIVRMISANSTAVQAYAPGQSISLNRQEWGNLSFSFGGDYYESPINFYLFKYNITGTSTNGSQSIRFASFKITRGGVVLRDMISVRFTNELGNAEGAMYNRLGVGGMNPDGSPRNDGLYRNQGTGSFLFGDDV
jgi:2',3'-cyclic-nucleotide 2'-phosphodiesterase (5'-nucleotidase family)